MEYKKKEHVRITVSLAVQVIDDFINRPMEENLLSIGIEGAKKPIRKKGGYYIFVNLQMDKAKLSIRSAQFQDYEEMIDLTQLNPLEPVVKVRLKPNKFYSMPRGTTCVEGVTKPGCKIMAWCPEMTGYLKLMQDYGKSKDRIIQIFNPSQTDIEEKSFLIKEDTKSEVFFIQRVIDNKEETYLLKKSLNESYGKIAAKIYPVLLLETDAEGKFFAPIPFLEKEHRKLVFQIAGRKKVYSYDLEFGITNQVKL